MLSTSQSELSHQIAERVSAIINTIEPRIQTYKFVNKCYSLRSKYIHADAICAPEEEIVCTSEKLDEIVKATTHAILQDRDLRRAMEDNKLLDEIILGRVLSFLVPN